MGNLRQVQLHCFEDEHVRSRIAA